MAKHTYEINSFKVQKPTESQPGPSDLDSGNAFDSNYH